MRLLVWSIAIPACMFLSSLPLRAGHSEPSPRRAETIPPPLQHPQSGSPTIDETFVRAALQRKLDLYPRVPGFMVAIQEPGQDPLVIAEGYARISPPSDGENIPLVGTEYFRIASISKFYTATAIMRLREQGALSLTNTVADLAPELNAPRAEDVTVDLLLSHRSGMADAVNTPWFVNQFKQDPFRAYSLEETVSVVAHLYPTLLFEPGTDYHYSDTGYSILARIIENVSGTTYQSFLRTELLDPLGLTNTFIPFNTDYDVPEPAIAQYATVNGVFGDWSRFSPSLEFGCGSIMATLHDVMRFAYEVLATTNVINQESQALMMEHGNGRGADNYVILRYRPKSTPVFQWQPAERTDIYRLIVVQNGERILSQWLEETELALTEEWPAGEYQWWVGSWNSVTDRNTANCIQYTAHCRRLSRLHGRSMLQHLKIVPDPNKPNTDSCQDLMSLDRGGVRLVVVRRTSGGVHRCANRHPSERAQSSVSAHGSL